MKGNGKLLPSLFSSFSKSCQKWNTLGRVELIPTVLCVCVCVCMCVCVCARAPGRVLVGGGPLSGSWLRVVFITHLVQTFVPSLASAGSF